MKNFWKLSIFISCLFLGEVYAQKPSISDQGIYRFKETPKISLRSLGVPVYNGTQNAESLSGQLNVDTNVNKKRGPSSNRKVLSVSGACTRQDGGIVTVNDPNYDSCLDGSVYVKKVILTDPTQSILMNVNLDNINFNPFD